MLDTLLDPGYLWILAEQVRQSEECPPVPRPSTGKGANSTTQDGQKKFKPNPLKIDVGTITTWTIKSDDVFPYYQCTLNSERGPMYSELDPQLTAMDNMCQSWERDYIVSISELLKKYIPSAKKKV